MGVPRLNEKPMLSVLAEIRRAIVGNVTEYVTEPKTETEY